jgi:hypothetical protein
MWSTSGHDLTETHTRHIAAALPLVWQLLKEIDAWPGWNGEVLAAAVDGPVEARALCTVTTSTGSWCGRIFAVVGEKQMFWGNVMDEGARWMQDWELGETIRGVQVTVTTTVLGPDPQSCREIAGNLQHTSLLWLDQLQLAAEPSPLNR